MNGKTILILTNVITIVITAFSVLHALHNKEHYQRVGWINRLMDAATAPLQRTTTTTSRSLQTSEKEPCCDCATGVIVDTRPPLFCFPSNSMVLVLGKDEPQRMETVTIGDYVLVADGTYEPIYSMAHLAPNIWSQDYIHIETTDSKNPILIVSSTHMVLVLKHKYRRFVPAIQVQPGDQMYNGIHHGLLTVKKVTPNNLERGAIAPFTPSGTLVVNGIVTSSYVQLHGIPHWAVPHSQWLAHTAAFPQRLRCYRIPHLCPQETYTKEGIAVWVDGPLRLSQYLLDDAPIWISHTGFFIVIICLVLLNALEYIVFDMSAKEICLVSFGAVLYYGYQKRKRCQPYKLHIQALTNERA
jgi:hypothetical protein